MFFMRLLWFGSELMALLGGGIVVARDWENLLPPNPGPGALMGVYCPHKLAIFAGHK
jgi:hypothetical protein